MFLDNELIEFPFRDRMDTIVKHLNKIFNNASKYKLALKNLLKWNFVAF